MASNVQLNDPSTLRIRKPDIECTPERIEKIQAKLNEKSPGWRVFRNKETGECLYYSKRNNNVKSYFPTPRINECTTCAIQGGSKKSRRHRKSKTQKRRK